MANDIFKRLVIAFFVALVISMLYSFLHYQSMEGLEARQGGFLIVALNFALNIINFLSSLPAFLNLNKYVRDVYILSFFGFCGAPLVILTLLLGIYMFGNNQNPSMSDFLSIALPSVVFNAALFYGFIKFRDKIDKIDNVTPK